MTRSSSPWQPLTHGSTNPMKPLKGVTSKNVPAQDKIDQGAAKRRQVR